MMGGLEGVEGWKGKGMEWDCGKGGESYKERKLRFPRLKTIVVGSNDGCFLWRGKGCRFHRFNGMIVSRAGKNIPKFPDPGRKIPNRQIPNRSVTHIEPEPKVLVRILVFNLPSFENSEPNRTIFIYN
ncbi:hypothetical protein ACFX1Q_010445 [Malus domestica]